MPNRTEAASEGAAEPRRKRKSKHTLPQLAKRPLSFQTCAGEVTLTAERKNGQLLAVVSVPEGVDVRQEPGNVT